MANSWGEGLYGAGEWGLQSNGSGAVIGQQLTLTQNSVVASISITASVTGEQLTLTENSVSIRVDAYPTLDSQTITGDLGSFSITGNASFYLFGESLTHTFEGIAGVTAEINSGWGRLAWGALPWGTEITNVTANVTGEYLNTILNSVYASPDASVFGEQLTLTLDSVVALADANTNVVGNYLETQLGYVDPGPDAVVYAEVANVTAGDLTVEGTGNLSLIGEQLSLTLDFVNIDIAVVAYPTGEQLTLTFNPAVIVKGTANIPVSGQHVDAYEGTVDAAPDADVNGILANLYLNNISTKIDVTASVIGQDLTLTENSVNVDIVTPVPVYGEGLTLTLNSVLVVINSRVILTGNSLTGYTGQLYSTAWAAVDTGASSVWTPVNTAA